MRARLSAPGLALALCLSAAAAAAPDDRDPTALLEWVTHTTPRAQLDADLGVGIRRFWVVCGIVCTLPGAVDGTTYALCYRDAALADELAGTGDYLVSKRHAELQEAAERFVREYNELLAQHLDAQGLRACPATGSPEEWLAPARELLARFGSEAGPWSPPVSAPESLGASLGDRSAWQEADAARLCAALAKGGLARRIPVRLQFARGVGETIACENGALLPAPSPLRSPSAASVPPPPP